MSNQARVLVSHYGKQGNVYQRPRAAENAGLATRFLTGLYYFPERLPYSLVPYLSEARRDRMLIELEKRRQEGLSPGNVVSLLGPLLETTCRPFNLIRTWGGVHDWLASQWLQRNPEWMESSSVIHTFQDTAIQTLRTAGKAGAVRIHETTLPPMTPDLWPELAAEDPEFVRAQRVASERLKRELELCEWAVAQSTFSVEAITALGFPRERVLAVPLGVDTEVFQPAVKGDGKGKLQVLFVGTISRIKGVHYLLRAWRDLNLKDAELTLIGNVETPEARELLTGAPAGVKTPGNVTFAQLLGTYGGADLLVHPSLAEGGCNVVHEALACGLPCVITRHAASAVRNEVEGFVVEAGDVDGLKERLATLHASPQLRARMAVAARKRAEELSWVNYVARLGAIYRSLAQRRNVRPAEADVDVVFGNAPVV